MQALDSALKERLCISREWVTFVMYCPIPEQLIILVNDNPERRKYYLNGKAELIGFSEKVKE